MKIINWIFGKKMQETKPQVCGNVRPLHKDNSTAKAVERVRGIGLSGNPHADVMLEVKYINEHPCNCGGQWEDIGGGSGFPRYVYSSCKCKKCGAEKDFIFYF